MLVNGGFEAGTLGWSISSGEFGRLDTVGSPIQEGKSAAVLTGSQLQTHTISQWIQVQPGQEYRFSGWVLLNDPAVSQVYLEVTWWEAGGSMVGSSYSAAPLTGVNSAFRLLDTGTIVSPVAARSARVAARIWITAPFTIYLDGLAFDGPALVATTPAPTATPAVTPAPTATPSATSPPIPTTPTPTAQATSSPTSTPTPDPASDSVPTPAPELSVFPHLVNGGFEQLRGDLTPFGWRKQGGEMTTTDEPRAEGARALALTSRSASTKWVYQTVVVTAGAYYRATVRAMPGAGVESVFLRISWYASEDGSGSSADQVDSLPAAGSGALSQISVEAVQAPADARSARVRLMLRPSSEAPATAYFDAVTFSRTPKPADNVQASSDSHPLVAGEQQRLPGLLNAANVDPDAPSGAAATPAVLANVKPPDVARSLVPQGGGDAGHEWAIILAITMPMLALTLIAAVEIWRRRHSTDTAE